MRALEVRSNLEQEFPSFVKSLVRSHVASLFWMVGLGRIHDFKLTCILDKVTGGTCIIYIFNLYKITGASWGIL